MAAKSSEDLLVCGCCLHVLLHLLGLRIHVLEALWAELMRAQRARHLGIREGGLWKCRRHRRRHEVWLHLIPQLVQSTGHRIVPWAVCTKPHVLHLLEEAAHSSLQREEGM